MDRGNFRNIIGSEKSGQCASEVVFTQWHFRWYLNPTGWPILWDLGIIYTKIFYEVFDMAPHLGASHGSNFCPLWNLTSRCSQLTMILDIDPWGTVHPNAQVVFQRTYRCSSAHSWDRRSSAPLCAWERDGANLRLHHYFPDLEVGNIWTSKLKYSLVFFWLLELSHTIET